MINAYNELSEFLKNDFSCIECLEINVLGKEIRLQQNYSKEELDKILETLREIEYDNGYGGQELYGLIWFKNGDWAERGEYDGSEWWEYKTRPQIPDYLIRYRFIENSL